MQVLTLLSKKLGTFVRPSISNAADCATSCIIPPNPLVIDPSAVFLAQASSLHLPGHLSLSAFKSNTISYVQQLSSPHQSMYACANE